MPSWLQLTLESSEYDPEQLEQALLQAGALAVTLQDAGDRPVLEPAPGATPLWPKTRVTGLFDAGADPQRLKASLRRGLGTVDLPHCDLETLADRDWARVWLDDFQPMRFGRRLWVCPTGQRPPDAAAVTVTLDPGLAFGTGTHPSTALCLEWLDGAELAGKTALDYGCGSGILAIAAARLGACRVWAVDIDPQALLASADNAARNDVRSHLSLTEPDQLPPLAVDILLANILTGTLIELAPRFEQLLKPGGRLVLSGILLEQVDIVQAAYAAWIEFGPPRQREQWALLPGVRRP